LRKNSRRRRRKSNNPLLNCVFVHGIGVLPGGELDKDGKYWNDDNLQFSACGVIEELHYDSWDKKWDDEEVASSACKEMNSRFANKKVVFITHNTGIFLVSQLQTECRKMFSMEVISISPPLGSGFFGMGTALKQCTDEYRNLEKKPFIDFINAVPPTKHSDWLRCNSYPVPAALYSYGGPLSANKELWDSVAGRAGVIKRKTFATACFDSLEGEFDEYISQTKRTNKLLNNHKKYKSKSGHDSVMAFKNCIKRNGIPQEKYRSNPYCCAFRARLNHLNGLINADSPDKHPSKRLYTWLDHKLELLLEFPGKSCFENEDPRCDG